MQKDVIQAAVPNRKQGQLTTVEHYRVRERQQNTKLNTTEKDKHRKSALAMTNLSWPFMIPHHEME